jgi:hypothetical protein
VLKKDGGQLVPGNVRLMHIHCNRVDFAIIALEMHLLSLTDEDGAPLDRRAVAMAMEYHLQLLAQHHGRVPKGHKSWASATRVALKQHQVVPTSSEGSSPQLDTARFDRWRQRSTSASS